MLVSAESLSTQLHRDKGIQLVAQSIFKGLSPSYDLVLNCATLLQDRYWKNWLINDSVKGWRILDLGCGTCLLEQYLSGKGCRVIGLDLTTEMIKLGRMKNIRCVDLLMVGDAEMLPYSDSTFDAVFSCYLAKYCEQRTLIREIKRVLKAGGKVALYDFSRPKGLFAPFHAFYVYGVMKIIGWLLGRLDYAVAFTFTNLPDIIRMRKWDETLAEAFKDEGFDHVVKTSLSGGVVTAFHATKL